MDAIIPDFSHETAARARGALWVVGVDEVGRGPLAGPVTACAVRLDPDRVPKRESLPVRRHWEPPRFFICLVLVERSCGPQKTVYRNSQRWWNCSIEG